VLALLVLAELRAVLVVLVRRVVQVRRVLGQALAQAAAQVPAQPAAQVAAMLATAAERVRAAAARKLHAPAVEHANTARSRNRVFHILTEHRAWHASTRSRQSKRFLPTSLPTTSQQRAN
jgi:hypothetical protein